MQVYHTHGICTILQRPGATLLGTVPLALTCQGPFKLCSVVFLMM